jgi:hypothetical protein
VTALIISLIGLTVAAVAIVIAPRLTPGRVVFDVTPDTPKPFGYGMSWLAIKSADTAEVARVLGLTEFEPANWNTGIGTIYDRALSDGYVFVTPPVKGWTFVAGVPLPHPVGRSFVDKLTPLLARASGEFNEVQYFAAFPIIDYFAWARLAKGRLIRAFAIGDDGIVWNRGRLTAEERTLGLKLFDLRGIKGRTGDAGGEIILYPTQQQVVQLARAWSVDPTGLDKLAGSKPGETKALGLIARVPPSWRAERVRRQAA